MKTLYVLLVLTLIAQCLSTKCLDPTKPSKAEDCNNRELDSGEYYRCCFIEAEMKGVESKTCLPLSKEEYDDIGDYIDKSEKAAKDMGVDVEDYSIDCGSNYIVISILSLILLFI